MANEVVAPEALVVTRVRIARVPVKTGHGTPCRNCKATLRRIKTNGKFGNCVECDKINKRNHYDRNLEKAKARSRKWIEDNREYYLLEKRARNARYVAESTEHFRQVNVRKAHRRRTRKLNAEGTYELQDIQNIFKDQRGKCAYCATRICGSGKRQYHVDHIQPLSKGGSNWPKNLQLLCSSCNFRKSSKDPITFAQENGFLL